MRYITGVHALNLRCRLETCGDWHCSALDWDKPEVRDTQTAFFGSYGIETGRTIPGHAGTCCVADHIRALLDLLVEGRFSPAQGMRKDFICNDAYDPEVFGQVVRMRALPHWQQISRFMGSEYGTRWLKFLGDAAAVRRIEARHRRIVRAIWVRRTSVDFLQFLNRESGAFVLRGRAALVLCWGLNRPAGTIELDGPPAGLEAHVRNWCALQHLDWQPSTGPAGSRRFLIAGTRPEQTLVIEAGQAPVQAMPVDEAALIGGIRVWGINRLARRLAMACLGQRRLEDLGDLCWLCNRHFEALEPATRETLVQVFAVHDRARLEYLLEQHPQGGAGAAWNAAVEAALIGAWAAAHDRLGIAIDDSDDLIQSGAAGGSDCGRRACANRPQSG